MPATTTRFCNATVKTLVRDGMMRRPCVRHVRHASLERGLHGLLSLLQDGRIETRHSVLLQVGLSRGQDLVLQAVQVESRDVHRAKSL